MIVVLFMSTSDLDISPHAESPLAAEDQGETDTGENAYNFCRTSFTNGFGLIHAALLVPSRLCALGKGYPSRVHTAEK